MSFNFRYWMNRKNTRMYVLEDTGMYIYLTTLNGLYKIDRFEPNFIYIYIYEVPQRRCRINEMISQ